MAFGQGFLAGFKVGDDTRNRNILMKQRQEDRDREQYGRDLEAFKNDWQNTKGGMSDDEFVKSPQFLSLAKRHSKSKVFEKALQAGDGNKTKMRDMFTDSKGNIVLSVDTYDKDGKQISKGRPITDGRRSREKGPNDKVTMFSAQDLYNNMKGALQQSDGYVDMYSKLNASDELMKQQAILAGLGADPPSTASAAPSTTGGAAPATSSAGLGAEPAAAPAPAGEDAVPSTTTPGDPAPADTVPSASEKKAPPSLDGELTLKEREIAEEQLAVEQEITDLNNKKNMHMAQVDFATRQIKEAGAGMTYQQRGKMNKQIEDSYTAAKVIDDRLEELDPSDEPSTATKFGRAVGGIPGAVVDTAAEAAQGIADMPAVKATGEAVSDFWSGITGNEEKPAPPPKGTPKSLLFETKAKEAAENAKSSTTGEIKPQTQAQRNKIEAVNADLAATIADKKKIKRKQLIDYRKALHANILAKNMTVAQASANYNEVLKAMKTPPAKWKITMGANGDVLVARDDGYYRVDRAEDKGDPKLARQEENDDQKRMTDWSNEMTGGKGKNPRAASELASLIDQARNVVGFRLNQSGARAAIEGAYKMRENAVANATSAWGLQWIGTSPGDAKRENPSLAPFFAASLLGVGDAQQTTDFAKQLAVINGNQKLTEADWADTQNMAQALANAGVSGKEAMEAIVTLRKEGVTGPAALNAIKEFDWSK